MKAITITVGFVEDDGSEWSQVFRVRPDSLNHTEQRDIQREYRDGLDRPATLIPGPTHFQLRGTLVDSKA